MKRIIYIFIACVASSSIISCGPNKAEQELKRLQDSIRIQDSIKKENDMRAAIADSIAKVQRNNEADGVGKLAETFYAKVTKASPILPMFTSDFENVMRHAQSSVGENGIKGYNKYAFGGCGRYGSEAYEDKYGWTLGEAEGVSDTEIIQHVTFKIHYECPDRSFWESYNDKMHFVKVGNSWKINDIVRDGQSLKEQYRKNPPFRS